MQLETLKSTRFEPLTKEQLKNVTGGAEREGSSQSPREGQPMLFVHKGVKYYVKADKFTQDLDTGEYTCLELQDMKGNWVTIV
ncbi:bacteriocin [Flavobacterium hydatis]|uniref:Bacteriocin leader domain-containing protein n=1 Tax=Flavobacterium hydatis TaxID=991 RepID=A0A086A3B0_FLAHY|nr:bacteriocin [Flavobacterium hydatis]KFF11174.1 hypothetical protein IW20_19730 [Flavobacterium hydatis]OXA97833.1 bacteriocin leader domain-containing protein [Flavobacterium hydatis]